MDSVLADTLTANMKAAKTTDAKVDALVLANIALVDCQRKTSERVKILVSESEAQKNKLAGAKLVAAIARGALAIGGPTAAIAFCKYVGILW